MLSISIDNNIQQEIIILSDVHLGASNSNIDGLTQLLDHISRGEYPAKVEAIIVVGDFLDLIINTYKLIARWIVCQHIYRLLNRIYNQGIPFIYILGNHEISVTENYNVAFTSRKENLIELLEQNGFNFPFFKNAHICQYVIMGIRKQLEIYPIDSIDNNIIHGSLQSLRQKTLIAHGYQFERDEIRQRVGRIWNYYLQKEKYLLLVDKIWNGIERRVVETIEEENGIDNRRIRTFFKNLLNISNKHFCHEIADFVKKKYNIFNYYFENVIYGHTHEKGTYLRTLGNKRLNIFNTGTWHKTDFPNYVVVGI